VKKNVSFMKGTEDPSEAGNSVGGAGDAFRHVPSLDKVRFMDGQLQEDLRPFTVYLDIENKK
jgi:hypothetical protein